MEGTVGVLGRNSLGEGKEQLAMQGTISLGLQERNIWRCWEASVGAVGKEHLAMQGKII
jgi:hypothetical protein